MADRDRLVARLDELVASSAAHAASHEEAASHEDMRHFARFAERRRIAAAEWIASAVTLIQAIQPNPQEPHRARLTTVAGNHTRFDSYDQVAEIAAIFRALKADIDAGLLQSIEDEVVAAAFDTLLEHADEYLAHKQKDVAGVVAGVAFEDAMRRQRAAMNIEPDDISIENLIGAFQNFGFLSRLEGRRARSAADVRTSATHARWEEFSAEDVEAAIAFTRQFVVKCFS